MKTNHKLLLTTALVALAALLAYFFIPADNRNGQPTTDSAARVDNAVEPTAGKARTAELEHRRKSAPTEIYAQMQERYGKRYAVHEMDSTDVGKGKLLHLALCLVKGDTRKELGATSLGPESYRGKSVVAVAVSDGKARIERWGDDSYVGNTWPLTDEIKRECQGLNWSSERPNIKVVEEGRNQSLGTTDGGWNLVIEFWAFAPRTKGA